MHRALVVAVVVSLVVAVLLAPPVAPAQPTQAQAPPTPCAGDPDSRRFDFWIGEWDVRTAQGQPAGTSRIEPVSGGCALLEHWTDRLGATGKSLSAFNRALGRWQQFWVGQFGRVGEYRESTWSDGSVSFLARAGRPGSDTLMRLTFTPLSRDLVRQHGERSTDGGATWTTTYDFRYHRRVGP